MTLNDLTTAAADAVARWTDPERRPLFKGQLIDKEGCACAQGDVMLHNGFSADELRRMKQEEADAKVAALLGISRAHAILLRNVNDRADGAPEIVLTNPEKVLGDQAHVVLAFWRHLDRMTTDDWKKVTAARNAAWDAAGNAYWDAAWTAAWVASAEAAWDASWTASASASSEIQGARLLRERGKPFFFLPMFGFADPEAVLAADEKANRYD